MKNLFKWNYFGLNLTLKSDNIFFSKLIEDKFSIYNKFETKKFNKRKITISFSSNSFKKPLNYKKIISSTAKVTNKSLYLDHRYLTTKTTIETVFLKNNITDINIYFSTTVVFEVFNILTKNLLKRQLMQNIIKLYVEQSLLWNLCVENKLNCLHAASVEENGEVNIFVGLNGVGKSTLALSLVNTNKKIFSDNYLLTKGNTAYLSPDTVRLTKKSLDILNLSSSGSFGFEKYFIKNNDELFSNKFMAKINNIYILYRGDRWNKKKLGVRKATNIIRNLQISNDEEILYAPVSQMFASLEVEHSLEGNFYELTTSTEKIPYEI